MKQIFFLVWALMVVVSSPAQDAVFRLDTFGVMVGESLEKDALARELEQFIEKIKQKEQQKGKNIKLLEWIHWRLHCTYLSNYVENAFFKQTLRKEAYNCVTGTMLWAYLLDRLGIQYQIFETNYHVYLIAQYQDTKVLIESTSPKNGIIPQGKKFDEKRAEYEQKYVVGGEKNAKTSLFMKDKPIHREINLLQLTSLQLFNKAVKHYNQLQFEQAILSLQEANKFYLSDRNLELLSLAQKRSQQNP